MWAMGTMELTPAGPDTYDEPHETGAARTAAQASEGRKTILESIKRFSISDWNNIPMLHLVSIYIIFYYLISKS